ncbi:MAG: hypothetical protein ACFFAS_19905 [Promethearchaeota archaeon]
MIITLRVDKYLPDNVIYDYEDGSFEWFDSTAITILEASKYKNKMLYIDHEYSCKKESVLRKVGAILKFELDPHYIESSNT